MLTKVSSKIILIIPRLVYHIWNNTFYPEGVQVQENLQVLPLDELQSNYQLDKKQGEEVNQGSPIN